MLIRPGHVKKLISIPITIPSTKNIDQDYSPVTITAQATVGRLWWASGLINITCSLPRSGYSSGKFISFHCINF